MRILIVIPALGAPYGGPSRIATDLAAALARCGTEVNIVTTNADGRSNAQQPLGKWIERNGCRVRYFPRWGRSEFKFSPKLFYWLISNTKQYDLVHIISLFSFPVLAAALACRMRRVPYLINPQGMLEPWALRHKAWKKRIYYLVVERPMVLAGAAVIHALNQSEAQNIALLDLRVPIVILPNGIDPGEANMTGAMPEPFLSRFPHLRCKRLILFLHRIDPKKGLGLLAKAFAQIHGKYPDVNVVVAGPDLVGHTQEASGFFAAEGCSGAVTFTGIIVGNLKRSALAAASVFVLPSQSEGFSMSVLEAMAAALPCVITTGCNFPEAGEVGAARVVAPEAAPFAMALDGLLSDANGAREMGQRAQDFVLKNYTWANIAEKTVMVYNSILIKRDEPLSVTRTRN